MKKQVLLCLALMLLCFITGGVYIVTSIQTGTKNLERVISFHEVEFLRKNLILQIKAVQSNLLLQGSPHARDFQSSTTLIEHMEQAADVCLNCHHSEETRQKLTSLEEAVELYMKQLSRTLTIRANAVRMENARTSAFSLGEELLQTVETLSMMSQEKVSRRIADVNADINRTNQILIACLILGPIAILIITLYFLQRFTGSISALVEATASLEEGNLDYRITGKFKDEFKRLANAFNGMAQSIKDEREKFKSVHKLYQTLFESAGDAIMITSLDRDSMGQIISANKAATELYGYSLEELLEMNIEHLIPEGKVEKFRNKIRKVLLGGWSYQRVRRIRKDGTAIHVDLSMGVLHLGEQRHLLSFCRDVTEKMQAEEEMHRANQMALVGQMAVGLAHEIKNPLAGIKVSLDVLADDLDLQPEDQELFVRVINEINRMEKLLKSLLNYARPPQPHFDLVDINRLLDNSLKHIEVTASGNKSIPVHFETDLAAGLPQVEADSSQMQQVFLNILLNAVDALETEGTISTITRMDGVENVWIEISDSGRGIPTAAIENIFNPFYTTKTKGTGLGLSICKRLVEQHGGTIVVDSLVDQGTSFIITLPLTQKNLE